MMECRDCGFTPEPFHSWGYVDDPHPRFPCDHSAWRCRYCRSCSAWWHRPDMESESDEGTQLRVDCPACVEFDAEDERGRPGNETGRSNGGGEMSNGRKVSTDALETLGTIIGEGEKRDAIHLAVLPMVAGEDLPTAQDIVVKNGVAVAATRGEATGIVDPFLGNGPRRGERFWMVLKPRMVTSLRHVWSHPAFEDEHGVSAEPARDKAASEKWLREFIAKADCPGYERVIAAAVDCDDEYLHFSGYNAHGVIPPEFWDHVETVTGQKVRSRAQFFSCSC